MNRKAILLVTMVFVLGVVVGAAGYYIAAGQVSAKPRATVVQRLTTELSLSAEQQKQVSDILDETRKKYDSIYGPVRPQMEAARQEGRQKIRAILTPEQQVKFEEHLRRIDEERAKRGNK
jgi:Spy/CpxP family protein refolding chaperone